MLFVKKPFSKSTRIDKIVTDVQTLSELPILLGNDTDSDLRIDKIKVKAVGTTAAGIIRIFNIDDNGSYQLIIEIPVTAKSASNVVTSFEAELETELFLLKAELLYVCFSSNGTVDKTTGQNVFNVQTQGFLIGQ